MWHSLFLVPIGALAGFYSPTTSDDDRIARIQPAAVRIIA
jgi:hypothetical protein